MNKLRKKTRIRSIPNYLALKPPIRFIKILSLFDIVACSVTPLKSK